MSKTWISITMGCSIVALALFSWAQGMSRPGLWEMTTTMNWQKSPMPAGVTLPAGMKSPFSGTTTTTQVCLTQAMIDKYGAPMGQNKDCKMTNLMKSATSMTADMVCSGKMSGKGTVQSTLTDGNHSKSKVHFAGTMGTGADAMPVEWTSDTLAAYKGSDCGSVKPLQIPSD